MKNLFPLFLVCLLFSCENERETDPSTTLPFLSRVCEVSDTTLTQGSTYLSIYSEIYSQSEHRTHDLTATVSMRNPNTDSKIYIQRANFYNTKGELIRTYWDQPVCVLPMETLEIVINKKDRAGGSGANFIFEWQKDSLAYHPIFEAVMISTSGQQGLSFTTTGKHLSKDD